MFSLPGGRNWYCGTSSRRYTDFARATITRGIFIPGAYAGPTRSGLIVRGKSHFKWNCCTDFFCQFILVHNGLRQHFPEGVQNFVQWHFLKSNMAAATSLNH